MNRLTAKQILESYDFCVDDARSEDENDEIELRIDTSEDEANEPVDDNDDQVPSFSSQTLRYSTTFEMLDLNEIGNDNEVIYGRQTKTKPKPAFEWLTKPNSLFPNETNKLNAKIVEELKNEKSIIVFFKKILSCEIMTLIVEYTNQRINLIQTINITNESYRKQFERLISKKVTLEEMYAFVGLMILFGLTGKSDISIEEIWSEKSANYAEFAAVTFSRERFQLITRNICFDDLSTRNIRKTSKFHKMEQIFTLFKNNLKLITPSFCLCVDETLYSFRGHCFCRQFIPTKPARYGLKYWCLVDTTAGN
jgi:hypothetical protein